MTKSQTKKLKLSRETVRTLDARPSISENRLKQAAGGLTYRCYGDDSGVSCRTC